MKNIQAMRKCVPFSVYMNHNNGMDTMKCDSTEFLLKFNLRLFTQRLGCMNITNECVNSQLILFKCTIKGMTAVEVSAVQMFRFHCVRISFETMYFI